MKKIVSIIFSLFLISSSIFIPAFAQMNPLNNTEKSNIDLVVRNLHNLIDYTENLIKSTKNKKTIKELEESKKLYEKITQNIEVELKGGKIVSVPGLDDSKNKKYRHNGELGSPKAAFCGDGKTQVKDASGKWVDCPKGNMLVDKKFLDPLNGATIDESTQDGWQKKWELAHILVHEKAHELMINEQIEEFQKNPWWKELPQSEKDKKIQIAIEKATTVDKHGEVFLDQKGLLKLYSETLEDQKKKLSDEKKSLKNTAENKARKTQIDSLISAIDNKIKWLDKTWRDLEKAMENATKGTEFGFEHCGWPLDFHSGVAAISVTFPAGYERFDLSVEDDNVIDLHITKTEWYGQTILVEPISQVPNLYIQMPVTVFSGQFIQPETCQYLEWATDQGLIEISQNPISEGIPDWIRQNSRWWSDGVISDREFANAIGYLVKENVLQVNIPINPDGTINVSNNLVIPSWIKSNAKWWSDGMTSDQEFTSAIEYMINQEIIAFSERSTSSTNAQIQITPDVIKKIYSANKWYEIAAEIILDIKNYEKDLYDDLSDDAWKEYSYTKEIPLMEQAVDLEEKHDKAQKDALDAARNLGSLRIQSDTIRSIGLEYGFKAQIELDDATEHIVQESKIELNSISDLKDAVKKADNAADKAEEMMIEFSSDRVLLNNIGFDQSTASRVVEMIIETTKTQFREELNLTTDNYKNVLIVDDLSVTPYPHLDNEGNPIYDLALSFVLTRIPSGSDYSNWDTKITLVDKSGKIIAEMEEPPMFSTNILTFRNLPIDPSNGPFTLIIDDVDDMEVIQKRVYPGIEFEVPDQPKESVETIQINVLNIGNKQYPIAQFTLWKWKGECNDVWHYHTPTGHAVNLELAGINDPDPGNCGFGKQSEIKITTVSLQVENVKAFKELTGIDPSNNKAMIGGEGP